MKRILTLLLVVAGLTYAGSLNAQTAPPPPHARGSADTTQVNKKSEPEKEKAAPSSASEKITIDEGGTSRPKHKKPNAKKSAKKSDEASPSAPQSIAIDESGTSKPKPRPRANGATAPEKSDSTILAPASQVGRPE
ncbi:MAG: hypothetical protein M3R17_01085 [Bacteroidota bacterium]|nr:hypothetical protein [Bacteroidota bacterium]